MSRHHDTGNITRTIAKILSMLYVILCKNFILYANEIYLFGLKITLFLF
jgi:hypothetical protein